MSDPTVPGPLGDPPNETQDAIMAIAGSIPGPIPTDVVYAIWKLHRETLTIHPLPSFDSSLDALVGTGHLSLTAHESGRPLLSLTREFGPRSQTASASLDELAVTRHGLTTAIQMGHERALSASIDGRWVASIAARALDRGYYSDLGDLGRLLFARAGIFRGWTVADGVASIARSILAATVETRDGKLATQLHLLIGEFSYVSGRHSEAKESFISALGTAVDSDDRLRAYRALGQVSYRAARYGDAQEYYEQAAAHSAAADPDFVATLNIEYAKTLFRLGRHVAAATKLRGVINERLARGDGKGVAKARHELARIYHAEGELETAEALYLEAVLGGEAERFRRFLPAPLYQLGLLTLERGNLPAATDYASRCVEAARDISDNFWICLSDFLTARVEYATTKDVANLDAVSRLVRTAQQMGWAQLVDDAREWLFELALPTALDDIDLKDFPSQPLLRLRDADATKIIKAQKYAADWHRISDVSIAFRSSTETRHIRMLDGEWTCTCRLFEDAATCTHIAALSLMIPRLFSAHERLQ